MSNFFSNTCLYLSLSISSLICFQTNAQAQKSNELANKVIALFPVKIIAAQDRGFAVTNPRKMTFGGKWNYFFELNLRYDIEQPRTQSIDYRSTTARSKYLRIPYGATVTTFSGPVMCNSLSDLLPEADLSLLKRISSLSFWYYETIAPQASAYVFDLDMLKPSYPIRLSIREADESLDLEVKVLDKNDPQLSNCPK